MNTKASLEITIDVSPAFYDVDPLEVVWHGHYVKFFELARSALLARQGYDYAAMKASGFSWPVVDLRVKYVRPARLGVPLKVTARIIEWENRLRVDYLIREAESGLKVTTAQTTQVAVDMTTGALQFVCPPALLRCLGLSP
jgi:acyl-CoA thioester hydrolase